MKEKNPFLKVEVNIIIKLKVSGRKSDESVYRIEEGLKSYRKKDKERGNGKK